jgi:beta-aspartyl-peptidase (threonine type)
MKNRKTSPAIIVHGGAWDIPVKIHKESIDGVIEAVQIGWDILKNGGRALDAVEQAVRIMEDNPLYDAGTGSSLNIEGNIQMDAVIVDGKTMNAGAIAGIKNIKNPISLARLVMEKTDHVFLIGEGAQKFAKEVGVPEVSQKELISSVAVDEFEKYKAKISDYSLKSSISRSDTVGAVALDSLGNIATATSTGGTTGKMVGRVGDSPLIGSGAFADNAIGGASSTGEGEAIMKVVLAQRVMSDIQRGVKPEQSVTTALNYMKERVDGRAGIIVLTRDRQIVCHNTTSHMVWAYTTDGEIFSGI